MHPSFWVWTTLVKKKKKYIILIRKNLSSSWELSKLSPFFTQSSIGTPQVRQLQSTWTSHTGFSTTLYASSELSTPCYLLTCQNTCPFLEKFIMYKREPTQSVFDSATSIPFPFIVKMRKSNLSTRCIEPDFLMLRGALIFRKKLQPAFFLFGLSLFALPGRACGEWVYSSPLFLLPTVYLYHAKELVFWTCGELGDYPMFLVSRFGDLFYYCVDLKRVFHSNCIAL